MNVFIDESGSMNNHTNNYSRYFIITLVNSKNKRHLNSAHQRFVSANRTGLLEADKPKITAKSGRYLREGGQMFNAERFIELKGNALTPELKKKFLMYFNRPTDIEVLYIKIDNWKVGNTLYQNTARAFNYVLRLAIQYYIAQGVLSDEPYYLHLDERNERTETRHFLQNYLNTELVCSNHCKGPFIVQYCNSSDMRQIQIADVFSNAYYSHLINQHYTDEFNALYKSGVIKGVFEFPL